MITKWEVYFEAYYMWLLRIYAFHKLTIALRTAHSAVSCSQECYIMRPRIHIMRPRMLYHAAKNAISCGQQYYIMRPRMLLYRAPG